MTTTQITQPLPIPCPLFNEDTRFTELLIEAEMESREAYDGIVTDLAEQLRRMHDDNPLDVEDFDYLVTFKDVSNEKEYASVNIALTFEEEREDAQVLPFEDFLKNVQLVVMDEVDGSSVDSFFELDASGFLKAIQTFNRLVSEH